MSSWSDYKHGHSIFWLVDFYKNLLLCNCLAKCTETWWKAPMEGSILSFLKAEWKVSDTGSAHWASSLYNCKNVAVLLWNEFVLFDICRWNGFYLISCEIHWCHQCRCHMKYTVFYKCRCHLKYTDVINVDVMLNTLMS